MILIKIENETFQPAVLLIIIFFNDFLHFRKVGNFVLEF